MPKSKEKSYVVYCATNTANGKQYVGQSCDFRRRRLDHIRLAGRPVMREGVIKRCVFYDALSDYGADSFQWEILETHKTIEAVNEAEERLIRTLNTMAPNGYNLSYGGDNHHILPETRKKISETQRGTNMGVDNPFFGKKHNDETRKVMSDKARGENSINAHLNWDAIYDIRKCLKEGTATPKELAIKHSTSKGNIANIKANKAWIDPSYEPPFIQSYKELTEQEIAEIYKLCHSGYQLVQLAKQFGCGRSKIIDIKFKRFRSDLLQGF